MNTIRFFYLKPGFRVRNTPTLKKWILRCLKKEKKKCAALHITFCDDAFLSRMNLRYLKHTSLTDIITFDYSERKGPVSGEIFISADRVRENANKYGIPFDTELKRVIIHGVLHLLGYRDKKTGEKKQMRKKEDFYINLFGNFKKTNS